MIGLIVIACCVLLVVLSILDLAGKVPLISWPLLLVAVPAVLNAPVLVTLLDANLANAWRPALVALGVLLGYVWLRLHLAPIRDGHRTGIVTKMLGGATPILYAVCWATIVQAVLLPLEFRFLLVTRRALIITIAWTVISCLLLYLNGALRAALLSKSLTVANRLFLLGTLWIPVIGWVGGIGAGRAIRREYRAAVERAEWERTTPLDDQCATTYPVLLVHGVGWRDRNVFNAWGRIPRYLKRHGARVFHGEQQAWGTIEQNGQDVARRIDEVCELTGSPKVNVIAHSRGGIDSRYAISTLGRGDKVASLTTMNTPHHGVRFADTATRMKEPVYLRLAAAVNWLFRLGGDEAPDFFASTMAFRTEQAREFNAQNPDDSRVHYQSWTSVMSSAASDRLLAVPYWVIKALGDDNDGLVTVDSARWGEFRGVFRSDERRGISHGDLVDYKWEDYHGFNVLAEYVKIVADLKQRGF